VDQRPSGSGPILCVHLLARVDAHLIDLLQSLAPEEWDLQTVAPKWKVRDVAAHLLDTVLRKLSFVRDGWVVERAEIRSHEDVIALVDRLNREGVVVFRRLSPPLLIDLMRRACDESARFHESLDPFAPAHFNVSWAGEAVSPNWFDTARELTERWHHQQQIRLATNRPGIMTRELYHPVLDCFVRGLPHLFRNVDAPAGTCILVEISGDCGGRWYLVKGPGAWSFSAHPVSAPASKVSIPQDLAWLLFTKGADRDHVRERIAIDGNQELGANVLGLTAIVG
jgi:uncharacterized protein (TIGR03083 family)